MILRKDINLVAFLFNKNIPFNPLVTTVYVDDSVLTEELKFKLGEYETEPEPIRRMPYKKKEPKPKKVKKEKQQKIKELPKKKINQFHIKLHHAPPIDISKTVRVAQSLHELPKDYERPKGQYSNPQWIDQYYKD